MARVKGAMMARKRRNKTLKLAKGYWGAKSKHFKMANEQVMKSLTYAYVGRRLKKRDFRQLWITRISAAVKPNGLNYSTFMHGLKVAGIQINRKMLSEMAISEGLFGAIVSLAFAFEGWICATSIGTELKDSKKNMPRALLIGTVIVAIVYVIYYVGLAGAVESEVMMAGGEAGAKIAFQNIFGQVGGAAIFVFVVISCWGTCNGLTMAVTRGMFDLAVESDSPKLAMFKNVDANTNMANNSAVFGLLVSSLWLLYFYGGTIMEGFGPFKFDSSELPIITLYAIYIPIYIALLKRKDLSGFRGKVMPVLAILCSLFMTSSDISATRSEIA